MLPTEDMRRNVGTWAVPGWQLPAVTRRMLDALPAEPFDPHFFGQKLRTTYLDTADLDLRRARKRGIRYLTLRVRSYPGEIYALSAKTALGKFRVELNRIDGLICLAGGVIDYLPGDLAAQLLAMIDDQPLIPAVEVCFHRYAVENETDRLTLDAHVVASTGRRYPACVLEQKSTVGNSAPLIRAIPLARIKLSKFLWSMPS